MVVRRPCCLLLFLVLASRSLAGGVAFDPPTLTVTPGEAAAFTVTIASTDVASFTALDMLLSSDTAGLVWTFDYSPQFQTTFPPSNPSPLEVFASDLKIGGFQIDGWTSPLIVGTLTIDTSTLAHGAYDQLIQVRPDAEVAGGFSPFSKVVSADLVTETISGSASLIVSDPLMDTDRDGVVDTQDAFPNDPTETIDTDGDGIGNNADPDDDNDGIPDQQDPTPTGEVSDSGNGDGTGDSGGDGNGSTTPPTGGNVVCGMGMLPILFFTAISLGIVRSQRRMLNRRG